MRGMSSGVAGRIVWVIARSLVAIAECCFPACIGGLHQIDKAG